MNEWLSKKMELPCSLLEGQERACGCSGEMPRAERSPLPNREKAGMAGSLPGRAEGGLPLEAPSPQLVRALPQWAESGKRACVVVWVGVDVYERRRNVEAEEQSRGIPTQAPGLHAGSLRPERPIALVQMIKTNVLNSWVCPHRSHFEAARLGLLENLF